MATSSPPRFPPQLIDGTVKNEKSDPKVKLKDDDRITLEGTTKEKVNNISILLRNLEFSDSGRYTCHVKNPKENHLQHQATITLQVVDKRTQWGLGQGSAVGRTGLGGEGAGGDTQLEGQGWVPNSVKWRNGLCWCFPSLYAFKSYWSYIWTLENLA